MRTFLFLIVIIVGILSCHTPVVKNTPSAGPANAHTDSIAVNVDSIKAIQDSLTAARESAAITRRRAQLQDTLLPFAGLWVNEMYVRKIGSTSSPRQSQGIEKSCITIPLRTLQATRMVYGFHDGAGNEVVVKKGDTYQFYNPDLLSGLDTLNLLPDGRLRIGGDYFIHLHDGNNTSHDLGILEQILFAGRYQRLDTPATAVFGEDGRIEGLDNMSYYEPVIDYSDWPNNFDHIKMGPDRKHLQDYGFRFRNDTLMIYWVDCLHYDRNIECDSEKLGIRLYVLPRVK